MPDKKLHGIVMLYVNMYPDLGQDIESTMKMVKEMNKPLIERLAEDGRYVVLFIPTTKEATRIEKIDYDAPYPRYMPKSIDISKVGLSEPKKSKKHNIFKEEEERELNGILSLFINFHPEVKLDPQEILLFIRTLNEDAIKVITEDGRYQLILVPTTKEASRIEKVDYDMPFPRLVPKAVEKTKPVVPMPFKSEPEKDEELEDEPDDDDLDDEDEE